MENEPNPYASPLIPGTRIERPPVHHIWFCLQCVSCAVLFAPAAAMNLRLSLIGLTFSASQFAFACVAFAILGAILAVPTAYLLIGISRLLHFLSGVSDTSQWQESFYRIGLRMVVASLLGSILWCIWNFGFFVLGIEFNLISWPIGILGNILGAWVYFPLMIDWYQLFRATKDNPR